MPHAFARTRLTDPLKYRPKASAATQITISHRPPRPTSGLKCCLCGTRPAFRMVERRYYCEAHTAEAFADQRKVTGRRSLEAATKWWGMSREQG